MKTGRDSPNNDTRMIELQKKVSSIMTLLLKKSIETACKYSKFARRDNLSGTDMIYALQYEAHEFMDRPELEEETNNEYSNMFSDSDSDSGSEESLESSESESLDSENFTRADSNLNEFCYKMNHYNDTWNSWHPEDPLIQLLKKAVDASKL